jgi:hypothetical protein
VLRRQVRGRVRLTNLDPLFLVQLYRWCPSILRVGGRRQLASGWLSPLLVLEITEAGKAAQLDGELRALIRRMSQENPLWGAPRIHRELLKLGFEVAQSSAAKYMVKRGGPPSQGWATFLRNTFRTSPRWTYSSFRPSALACSTCSGLRASRRRWIILPGKAID